MELTRITTKSLNESVLNTMYNNTSKLNELQMQISTGKRVDNPSDDANAAIDILTSNTVLNKIDIYQKNIDYAISEAEMTDQILTNVTDSIQKANELAVQAANGTNSTEELKNINAEIEQIIGTIQDAANTKFGNKYLFAGVNTEIPPFSETVDNEIIYNGTPSTGDYKRSFEINKNTTIDINFAGDAIFGNYEIVTPAAPPNPAVYGGNGLFNTMKTLSEALQSDPPDYDGIRTCIADLDTDLDNTLNARAKLGGVINRLEMTKNKHEEDKINYTKFKSSAEDIDLAKVISEYSFQETTLNASMKVSSSLMKTSLMKYL